MIGGWAHVAAVYDAGSFPDDPCSNVRIYVNARQIANGPFQLGDKPDAAMGIGCTHGVDNNEVFDGDIDEVQIYTRPLSADEIAYLADVTPGDGELIIPVYSVAEISTDEPAGSRVVNLMDFALLAGKWLETDLWP